MYFNTDTDGGSALDRAWYFAGARTGMTGGRTYGALTVDSSGFPSFTLYNNDNGPRILLASNATSYFNGGNLLVGTTTDAGFKFDVNGTSRVQGNTTLGNASFFGGGFTGITSIRKDISITAGGTYRNGQLAVGSVTNDGAVVIGYSTTGVGFLQAAVMGVTFSPLILQPSGGNVLVGTTTDAGFRFDVNGTTRLNGNITGVGTLGITIPSVNSLANGSITAVPASWGRPFAVDFTIGAYMLTTMDSQIHFGSRFSGVFFNGSQMYTVGIPTQIWGGPTGPNNCSSLHIGVNSTGEYQTGTNYPSTADNFFYLSTVMVAPNGAIYSPPRATPTRRSFILSALEVIFQSGNTGVERGRIFSSGNWGINTTTDAGFRLDVNGTVRIKGTGTTSATTAFTVQNSASTNALRVNDAGQLIIGNSSDVPAAENTMAIFSPSGGGTGEGGQLLLGASGGTYTNAAMLDTWQNQFRVLKGTNTGGSTASVFNIDLVSLTATFAGKVSATSYDGLPNSWMHALRNSNQTISSGTWADRDIIFNTYSSIGFTYNSTTGVATLKAGKVYRITARLAWAAAAVYVLQFRVYNQTTSSFTGPTVDIIQSTNGTSNISDGTLEHIWAVGSTDVDISIRTTAATNALTGEYIRGDLNTQLIIQQIA
jgi:hypothetical protein